MKLSDILPAQLLPSMLGDKSVQSISDDSRFVKKGALFFAVPGTKDNGALYIEEALSRGAVGVVYPQGSFCPPQPQSSDVFFIEVSDIRRIRAYAAARFFPHQPRHIAAVTGTSGKSSVVSFLRQIWQGQGYNAASIGTVGVQTQEGTTPLSLTTPGPIALHGCVDALARKNVTHLALEASSHGIDQERLSGLNLSVAGFTNLGHDHLDYHPSMEAYFLTKMRLFSDLLGPEKPCLIFLDAPYGQEAAAYLRQKRYALHTIGQEGEFIKISDISCEGNRQKVVLYIEGKRHALDFPLLGRFQLFNALLALGMAWVTGGRQEKALQAFQRLQPVKGRLQWVGRLPHGARLYVDYAHKPEALEQVLSAARSFTKGRIWVVFGCGGDRDKGKRPIMGAIAARCADRVVITDDNPRSEDAAQIRKEILEGAPLAQEIGDRAQAIAYAIGKLEPNDTLIVAGKGHETVQIIGGKTYAFSDEEEILKGIKKAEQR